jgi:hypothetical protein
VRPYQSLCLDANTKIRCLRNNSRTFTIRLNFLLSPSWLFFKSALLASPSLFSCPYSYPLHFPSFSCATIHCSPSQLFFLPLLIQSFLCLHLSLLLSFPNLSQLYPSLLHTHHSVTSLLSQPYTPPAPAIPDTSTLHYNNRNTSKHTQGPQNPATPILLPLSTHPFSHTLFLVPHLPITHISISSLITITFPTPTVYRYYLRGVFYIICKQQVWH